jgi:hypothetical protein
MKYMRDVRIIVLRTNEGRGTERLLPIPLQMVSHCTKSKNTFVIVDTVGRPNLKDRQPSLERQPTVSMKIY